MMGVEVMVDRKASLLVIGVIFGIILGSILLIRREHKKIELLRLLNLAGE